MKNTDSHRYAAFAGAIRIATGALPDVARAASQSSAPVLVFDRQTGKPVDLDLRVSPDDLADRDAPAPDAPEPDTPEPTTPTRGRPKLGVVAREVTLLPRHWDWLARQPGGASVSLRKLVEAASKADAGATDTRERHEAAYRFMSAMAGDLPGFEDAARALFAGDLARFAALIAPWPADIADEAAVMLGMTDR